MDTSQLRDRQDLMKDAEKYAGSVPHAEKQTELGEAGEAWEVRFVYLYRSGTESFDFTDKVRIEIPDLSFVQFPSRSKFDIQVLVWKDHLNDAYGHEPAYYYALSRFWTHRR